MDRPVKPDMMVNPHRVEQEKQAVKQPRRDPVTGDELTAGEYASWAIQGIIRRWSFLIVILLITAICWASGNSSVLLWWNLSASLLAIIIEAIVGKGMFGQTKRDAVVLRETRAIAKHIVEQDKAMLTMLAKLNSQEDLMMRLIEMRITGEHPSEH